MRIGRASLLLLSPNLLLCFPTPNYWVKQFLQDLFFQIYLDHQFLKELVKLPARLSPEKLLQTEPANPSYLSKRGGFFCCKRLKSSSRESTHWRGLVVSTKAKRIWIFFIGLLCETFRKRNLKDKRGRHDVPHPSAKEGSSEKSRVVWGSTDDGRQPKKAQNCSKYGEEGRGKENYWTLLAFQKIVEFFCSIFKENI